MTQTEERHFNALRWSADVPTPDVPPPAGWNELTTGYTFNAYAARVDIACSSSSSHAIGTTEKTNAQQPISLFSSRALALRALRGAMERGFARQLAAIDTMLDAS